MKTDHEIRNGIMNALIECRNEKGLSQAELAKIIEKSPTAVASWEQGLSLPSPQMLYRLAAYYGKTIEYMYGIKEGGEK
ncbi:MAG: helix-turn-helix transcriptional regulator [Clostridia bacterium]|nr:helix-turn-helix transcriptional regulator [Clostridia bacterium]